jgi:osmotically inducible protein OsmC
MAMQRNASVTWRGKLTDGYGQLTVGTGAFPEQTVTFRGRTEDGQSQTSPEELLAAAHAICYSMALSHRLTQNETPPETLSVSAVCSLDRVDGGLKITRMELTASGDVPGVTAGDFVQLAREAEERCPVSNALRGNVEIALKATLAEAGVR